MDEVRCSTLSHIRTMRTFTLARQWHREAWSLLHGPLKWWFLPAAALTLALSALGWWGISALALSVADAVVNRMAPEHEAGWAKVALEWLVWLVLLAVKLKLTLLKLLKNSLTNFMVSASSIKTSRILRKALKRLKNLTKISAKMSFYF